MSAGTPTPRALWVCACGHVYLMRATATETRYWPRTSVAAYSRHGLTADCLCIGCCRPIRGKRCPARLETPAASGGRSATAQQAGTAQLR